MKILAKRLEISTLVSAFFIPMALKKSNHNQTLFGTARCYTLIFYGSYDKAQCTTVALK